MSAVLITIFKTLFYLTFLAKENPLPPKQRKENLLHPEKEPKGKPAKARRKRPKQVENRPKKVKKRARLVVVQTRVYILGLTLILKIDYHSCCRLGFEMNQKKVLSIFH